MRSSLPYIRRNSIGSAFQVPISNGKLHIDPRIKPVLHQRPDITVAVDGKQMNAVFLSLFLIFPVPAATLRSRYAGWTSGPPFAADVLPAGIPSKRPRPSSGEHLVDGPAGEHRDGVHHVVVDIRVIIHDVGHVLHAHPVAYPSHERTDAHPDVESGESSRRKILIECRRVRAGSGCRRFLNSGQSRASSG